MSLTMVSIVCSSIAACAVSATRPATRTVGDSDEEKARRTLPNNRTASRTLANGTALLRTLRHANRCSHASLATGASHDMRNVRPQRPVTETSCTSARLSTCEYAGEPQVAYVPGAMDTS